MNAFSQIVCGAGDVRGCFDDLPGARVWWRLVLALHGKPTGGVKLTPEEREKTLRDGLWFYVALYRFLAICLAGCGLALGTVLGWDFPALGFLAASALLFPITRLGASAVRQPKRLACLFFAALIAFLSLLLGAGAAVAGLQTTAPPTLVLSGAASIFLFGVGSYAIELIYFLRNGK